MVITEQDLPEHGRDWVQFWGFENFPMDPALLGHSLVIQTQMLMDDVSWLEEEPVISSSYTMMYPVFLTDEIILGRMDNCILASTGGDQMGKVVEERVCIVIRGDGIYGFFSVLYDSDYVATFSLNLVHVFSGSSSKIAMYNRYTPNTRMIIMEYHETIECTFCQHRNMRCECTSLMQSRSLVGSTYHKEARRVSDTTNSYRTWESFVGFFTRILKRQRSRLTVMTSAGGKTAASVPTMRLQSTYFFKGPIVSALTMRHAQCLLKKRRPYNVILKLDAPGEYNHADKGQSVQTTKKRSKKTAGASKKDEAAESKQENPTCPTCGAQFTRKHDLRRHIQCVHNNIRNFVCTICQRDFSLRQNLLQHMEAVHEKRRNASCGVCGKAFQTEQKVRRHIIGVHFKDRPFSCSICQNAFFQRSDLKRHLREKHGGKTLPETSETPVRPKFFVERVEQKL